MPPSNITVTIFCSYTEQDANFVELLEKHLSILLRSNMVSIFHRRKIIPGSDWQNQQNQFLDTADLILLFISADFLASQYLYGIELGQAMAHHYANRVRVIPILIRSCDFAGVESHHLYQLCPKYHLLNDRDLYRL